MIRPLEMMAIGAAPKIKKIILRPESNQGYSVELTVEKTREMSGFTDLESINKNLDLFFMN